MANQRESMHLDSYERTWIIVSILMLVIFFGAVTVAGLSFGVRVPDPVQRVDPRDLGNSVSFSEPGLKEIAPKRYEAYIVAQTWSFNPREMTVPAGSIIKFYVTSKDVQHGFKLQNTNVNMQVVPGQVSSLAVKFKEPGEYTFICTEYCGIGHAAMYGKVIVTP
jgi:cytochrome c oxidase subunit 2